MSERIYETENSFEISCAGREAEVYIFNEEVHGHFKKGDVMITVKEENGWESQNANITMSAEEATALKNFLIKQGY